MSQHASTEASSFSSHASVLLANGFEPIPVNGKRPILPDWQSIELTSARIAQWSAGGAGGSNVGIRTGRLAALDIDILDEDVAEDVEGAIVARFGAAPRRIGRAPKTLLVYSAKEPGAKITSPVWVSPDGKEHRVEVLGVGQQFVAYGTHPDTQQPFTWPADDLATLELWELPQVDRSEVAAWIRDELPLLIPHDWKPKSGGAGAVGATDGDNPFEGLKPRHEDVDLPALRWMLAELAQDKCDDRDSWRAVVFGAHHQFHGTEEEAEALALVDAWSQGSVKYRPGEVERMWREGHGERGAGVVTIGTLKAWIGEPWRAYLSAARECAFRRS